MLVDIHAHLDYKEFDNDRDAVIKRAQKAGIVAIINNGINPQTNRKTLELAAKYPLVKPALGIYPSEAVKLNHEQLDKEFRFIEKSKPVALGEVGLDLKEVSELKVQKEVFERFIKLSEKMGIPLIVHSRKAEQEVFDCLVSSDAKQVDFHCFSGKLALARKIEDNGWHLSIPPNISHATHFQEIVKQVSLSHLLTETDSPFLSNAKGSRNEPANVAFAVKKIAELKGLDCLETENNLFMNFSRLFKKIGNT